MAARIVITAHHMESRYVFFLQQEHSRSAYIHQYPTPPELLMSAMIKHILKNSCIQTVIWIIINI